MVAGAEAPLRMTAAGYVELHAHSSHSLLNGVPAPEELVAQAAKCGMPALALTDHDGLYGAVGFVRAAEEIGIKPILGAEVTLEDESHLTLLAETRRGYANLCRLLTLGHRDQPKGTARLARGALPSHAEGLIALSGCRRGEIPRLLAKERFEEALEVARWYARLFGPDRFFIELQRHYHRGDVRLVGRLVALAERADLPLVATGNVHYLHPHQREIHDVLTCIRQHVTLEDAGDLLRPNDEYHFRCPEEMAALFAQTTSACVAEAAMENTLDIAGRCAPADSLLPSGPQTLPRFPVPEGGSPQFFLRRLCLEALRERYPADPPQELLEKELAVITQMELANYFLVVWDIVRFARRAGIRCQGRGSAANSLVAYLLGITPIDPVACDLVFERFLSPERCGPPDIDVDFAADRREEVIQYVYRRYGEEHAAMACTLITFRARSAVRDVARVLGFPPALVERLDGLPGVEALRDADGIGRCHGQVEAFGAAPSAGPSCVGTSSSAPLARGPNGRARGAEAEEGKGSGRGLEERPFEHLLRIAPQLEGIPRHLGIHNGGMILSGPPLCESVPLEPAAMEGRMVTQWDKEGLEGAGLIKVDLLGLRMLSAIEDALAIIEAQTAQRPDLDALPRDDAEVYDMICRGETVGIFQVESRAQANMIPRFQPRSFADLVVQISLVRPGPIQAQMVHPYLRRRQGREPVQYPHPLLKSALEETLGVIVFQEQVLKVGRDLAGFTAGEAELLRRALSHKRAEEKIGCFRERFLAGAAKRGVSQGIAGRVFEELEAFGGYSFPKSHAAAFAVLTYQSAWLRRYHPAAFFAALLRNQPMGFYPPHVIISEARRCGVEIRPVDVEASAVRTTVEGVDSQHLGAIRLGLAMVDGLGEAGAKRVAEAGRLGPFRSLADFCRRTKLGRRTIEALIWAGAFDGWEVPRRQLVWDLQAALEAAGNAPELGLEVSEERPRFGFLSRQGRLQAEVAYTGVSSSEHLVELVAQQLRAMEVKESGELADEVDGAKVRVGGVVVCRQRPPSAKGTAFITLEDEDGLTNVVLRPRVYEANRQALRAPFVAVEGLLQRKGKGVSVLARRVVPVEPERPR